ncbi:MAG: rhamnan synthesis F family protein, partial [Pygmaiobacter sp.]
FTKHFTDLGFIGAPYLDCTEWEAFMDYPLMGMPVEMLREKRTPFIKRKSFFSERSSYLSKPQGAAGGALLQYLTQKTDYDIHLILQNITRTVPAADYTTALSMTSAPEAVVASFGTVAAVLWLNSAAALPLAQKAIQQLPAGSGIFCIVGAALQEAELRSALPSAQLLPSGCSFTSLRNRSPMSPIALYMLYDPWFWWR